MDFAIVQKIIWTLQIIKEGDIIPGTYFKKLKNSDDFWEVRIKFAPNNYRILSFWDKGNQIVLTYNFMKKSQKTPLKEIKSAEAII